MADGRDPRSKTGGDRNSGQRAESRKDVWRETGQLGTQRTERCDVVTLLQNALKVFDRIKA